MKKSLLTFILALVACVAFAGLRGPGKYHGVVLFDRWGGCTLYSSVYVMYVTERLKESLRPYAGKAVVLDATKVEQPMNPGDGLLESFTYAGASTSKTGDGGAWEKADQVELTAEPQMDAPAHPTIKLVVHNRGPENFPLQTDNLAFTVLVHRVPGDTDGQMAFCPSDGPSFALVTRHSFTQAIRPDEGRTEAVSGTRRVEWHLRGQEPIVHRSELPAGESRIFFIDLKLAEGEYDIVLGYGGGTHSSLCVASKMIALDAAQDGTVTLPKIEGR